MGWTQSNLDPCVFFTALKKSEKRFFMLVYVDDIFFFFGDVSLMILAMFLDFSLQGTRLLGVVDFLTRQQLAGIAQGQVS